MIIFFRQKYLLLFNENTKYEYYFCLLKDHFSYALSSSGSKAIFG